MFKRFIFLSRKECEIIKSLILSKEKSIKSMGPDVYWGTSEDSLTGRHPFFNFFYEKEFRDIFAPKLKKTLKKYNYPENVIVQCWANTFRNNEGIKWHKHNTHHKDNNFLSANIFISGDRSIGTYYNLNGKIKKFNNRYGQMSLFDARIMHCVHPNNSKDIRISVAMDIHFDESTLWIESHTPYRYYTL
jgi:hypothetical protein